MFRIFFFVCQDGIIVCFGRKKRFSYNPLATRLFVGVGDLESTLRYSRDTITT